MDYQALTEYYQKLDRSLFLDEETKKYAGLDEPLPIGFEQTISQPSLVLKMTALLEPEKDSKVLEIGTGSGYQTALLAEMSATVFTVERIPELVEKAKKRLKSLGHSNIFFKIGDGSEGWHENAPFDRIIVTAAAGRMPAELIQQLAADGKMIIPVGERGLQELLLVTKDHDGTVHIQTVELVRFVEMKGKYGWLT